MKNVKIKGKEYPTIHVPLWYHVQGLMQTASGYGNKLNTGYKVEYKGKKRRIYCSIFSNIGRCYIIVKGKTITVE